MVQVLNDLLVASWHWVWQPGGEVNVQQGMMVESSIMRRMVFFVLVEIVGIVVPDSLAAPLVA